MIVVTSGASYLDIDAYAGCIAYAELLNLQGRAARAASSAVPNGSVVQSLRGLAVQLDPYTPQAGDAFVLVDVSDPRFFDPMAAEGAVLEVIDHHPGFERYWRERLGTGADIEPIGAACTQVFARWQRAGLLHAMRRDSACLLAAGILDNTLCFQAQITTPRDRDAYAQLARHAALPDEWPAQYFAECQTALEADLERALIHDCKRMEPTAYLPAVLGQLAVWDAQGILAGQKALLAATLQGMDADWLLNCISISQGKSYFLARSPLTQQKIHALLGCTFTDGVADAGRLWLRKELCGEALLKSRSV